MIIAYVVMSFPTTRCFEHIVSTCFLIVVGINCELALLLSDLTLSAWCREIVNLTAETNAPMNWLKLVD